MVTRSSMPPIEEYIEEIKDIWQSRWLTNMGQKHQALQAALQDYMRIENVELLVNGHMALELTLQAMNLTGEVIRLLLLRQRMPLCEMDLCLFSVISMQKTIQWT